MEDYIIHCNKQELQLIHSAVELQMRVRLGQGWAIVDNVTPFTDKDYRRNHDIYDSIFDALLRPLVFTEDKLLLRQNLAKTRYIERDIWIGLENVCCNRNEHFPMSEYGILKIEKQDDDNYSIHCNYDQLDLITQAVILQLDIRDGAGDIVVNNIGCCDSSYLYYASSFMLSSALNKITCEFYEFAEFGDEFFKQKKQFLKQTEEVEQHLKARIVQLLSNKNQKTQN